MLEKIVIVRLFPKSQLDVHVFVMENDGSVKAAAVNAAVIALVDAGVALKDVILASSSGRVEGAGPAAGVDTVASEEKRGECEFTLVYAVNK